MSEYLPGSSKDPNIFDNRNTYAESWVGVDIRPLEVTAPALLTDKSFNEIWNEEKALRHQNNVQNLTGRWRGQWYENGQPR